MHLQTAGSLKYIWGCSLGVRAEWRVQLCNPQKQLSVWWAIPPKASSSKPLMSWAQLHIFSCFEKTQRCLSSVDWSLLLVIMQLDGALSILGIERKQTLLVLQGRRASKLISVITSIFSASYVFRWKDFFPTTSLKSIPCFDGRAVAYPSDATLSDYLSWRQSDTHINNQARAFCIHGD